MQSGTRLEMPELPYARCEQHNDLGDTVPYGFGVRNLGQIPEVRLTFSLILLLSADIFKLVIEVAHFGRYLRYVCAVLFNICFRRAHIDVEVEPDVR